MRLLFWIVFLGGYLGSVLSLPGPLLMAAGVFLWRFAELPPPAGWGEVVVVSGVLLAAEALEQLGGYLSLWSSSASPTAKRGSILGLLASVPLAAYLLNPLLLLLGLLLGAWIGEMVSGRSPIASLSVAGWVLLGKVGGYLFKVSISTAVLFYWVLRGVF